MAPVKQLSIKVKPEVHAQLQSLAVSLAAEVGRVIPVGALVQAFVDTYDRQKVLARLRGER
jgi:hypothetical protein